MDGFRHLFTNRLMLSLVFFKFFVTGISAHASGPTESIVCTDAPLTTWVGEKKIRDTFGESAYAKVFFKISKGNCYEFYAIGKDGSIVEAYYDPVSMRPLRISRFDRHGNLQQPIDSNKNTAQK